MTTFKVVKSIVKPTTRVVYSSPLKVGERFNNLDLTVAPLYDHTVILGKDFLNLSKAILLPHENHFMFLSGTKTYSVPMMTRRKLRRMPRMLAIKLIEATNDSAVMPYVIAQQQE
jgi:hypothetical protein